MNIVQLTYRLYRNILCLVTYGTIGQTSDLQVNTKSLLFSWARPLRMLGCPTPTSVIPENQIYASKTQKHRVLFSFLRMDYFFIQKGEFGRQDIFYDVRHSLDLCKRKWRCPVAGMLNLIADFSRFHVLWDSICLKCLLHCRTFSLNIQYTCEGPYRLLTCVNEIKASLDGCLIVFLSG